MSKVDQSVVLAGVRMKNPVVVASGTFGFGREYGRFYDLSELGGICCKGLTLCRREGNPPPRIAETPMGILNSVGLQNPGVDAFIAEELPELRKHDLAVIANISGNTPEEYGVMCEKLSAAGVDMIEVNISCPNVKALGLIVELRARAVGRKPAQSGGIEARLFQSAPHGQLGPGAPCFGRGQALGIHGGPVAQDLRMDMGAPGLRRGQALQHEGRAALTGHEAVPAHVEGTRARTGRTKTEGTGLVIAQQSAQRKAAVPGRDQYGVGQTEAYAPPAFAQGLQGRGAGRVDGQGLAMAAGKTGQCSGGGIGQPAQQPERAQRRGILRRQARFTGDVQHGPHGGDDLRTECGQQADND